MFGVDNLCWISAKATLEASRLAEFLILQTGLTALGKAYYRYQRDLVPNVSIYWILYKLQVCQMSNFHSCYCVLQLPSKIEALRDEYMRYAMEKCLSILKENHAAVETITGKVI